MRNRVFPAALLLVVVTCAAVARAAEPTYPPGYKTFASNFSRWVAFHGEKWVSGEYGEKPAYYGQYEPWYGWRKAAAHFGDSNGLLDKYSQAACKAFRDGYVLVDIPGKRSPGKVPGYYNYTDGFRLDYVLHGTEASREAVVALSKNAAYAREGTPVSYLSSANDRKHGRSREAAYAALSYLNAEVYCGEPHRERLDQIIELMLGDDGHIEQWLGDYKTDEKGKHISGSTNFEETNYAPFFGAITAWTLLWNHENAESINGGIDPDPRIIPKLTRLADATWNECWEVVPNSEAFSLRPNQSRAAPDLSNTVFPYYAWLYLKTGQPRFRTRCDRIFVGSRNAYLRGSKQFNQYCRWTFDGLDWYAQGVEKWGGR